MNLDKKAKEILKDKLNEHKHRMADALFGSTEEMVLDAIKQALTISVVIEPFYCNSDDGSTSDRCKEQCFLCRPLE